MTTDEHIPELIISADAYLTLVKHGIPAWNVMFSILLDPEVDEVNKFEYLRGTVEFADDEWYASYRILPNGDIEVSMLQRLVDLLDIRGIRAAATYFHAASVPDTILPERILVATRLSTFPK